MCGRFTISVNQEDLKEHLYKQFGIEDYDIDFFLPRYNIAPGENIIAVISDGKNNRAGLLRWGFIPHFQKDEKASYKMINAKAETISKKPSFRDSFKNRRCIILADSYYEWQKVEDKKVPMRIMVKDKKIFSIAGIWSPFIRDDGSKIYTCAIITTAAGSDMISIHDRVPVILNNDSEKVWLNPTIKDPLLLSELLNSLNEKLTYYQVSTIVNNPRNDSIECIIEKN